jgi:hypothetical protein
MLSTPTPLEQAALLFGLLLVAGFLIGHPWGRLAALRTLGAVWDAVSTVSARFALAFHYAVPAKERDGSLPRIRLWFWCGLNILVVLLWLTGRFFGREAGFYDVIGWINALFALVNLTLVTGAYAALQEGVAIMNAEEGWRKREFKRDALAVRHAGFVIASVVFLGLQTAAVMHWLQAVHNVPLVTVRASLGSTYFDILAALLNALPFTQIMIGAPRLADGVSFSPGLGFVFGQAFTLFGAALLISTLINFVQQHIAFRKMIERLLVMTDVGMRPLVLAKFKRAPSAIKRYLGQRFGQETAPEKQIKLLELSVERPMWSAPIMFMGRLPRLAPEVKREGGAMMIAFVDQRVGAMDEALRGEIVERAKTIFSALDADEDKSLAARIMTPCLELLCASNDTSVASHWARELRRKRSLQRLLETQFTGPLAQRSAALIVSCKADEAWPALIEAMSKFSDAVREPLLQDMADIISSSSATGRSSWPTIMDAANDRLRDHPSPAFEAGLMRLRATITAKQRQARPAPAGATAQAAAA